MNGIEKKLRAKNSYPIDMADYDDNARFLIGWPGYRTSRNRSGLGYVETQAELAHMQGLMIHWIFTGKFITHNPFFLLMIALYGFIIGVFPLIMLLTEIFLSKDTVILGLLPVFLPYLAIGIGLFINVVISIVNPDAKSITGD